MGVRSNINLMPTSLSNTQITNFWNRVEITANDDKCWNWTGASYKKYGKLKINKKKYFSHRLSYYLCNKVDPLELFVCHKCDNPSCVNPTHLFLGTIQDNTRDMINKGRYRGLPVGFKREKETILYGIKKPLAKLNEESVKEIRRLYIPYIVGLQQLANKFGVSKKTILNIIKNKIWIN